MVFTDNEFPASARSLYTKLGHRPTGKKVASWRRPSQFVVAAGKARGVDCQVEDIKLFVDGVAAGDVIQGQLGDCYFLGALSVVATRPELLQKLFVESDLDEGRFVLQFYKDGEWQRVTVDDQIPCTDFGTPAYASCFDAEEIWVPIVEKAYAKLHGNYQVLEGGSVSEALVDLTGGAAEKIRLDDDAVQKELRSGKLWERVSDAFRRGFLLGAALTQKEGKIEADNGNGILINHAYGIVDVRTVGTARLMRLRNPWGKTEWTGAWSDGSRQWTPNLLRQLSYEFGDDGTFWMEFGDFCANFTKIHICRLYDDNIGRMWDRHIVPGTWDQHTAGGGLNHPTWRANRQFLIEADDAGPTALFITVAQDDQRMKGSREYDVACGFVVLRTTDSERKKLSYRESDILVQSEYIYARETSRDVVLRPGEKAVVIPSTYAPDMMVDYTLTVYAERPVKVSSLPEGPKKVAVGEWAGKSAGGCPNYPTWVRNPQFFLMPLDQKAKFTVIVRQDKARNRPTHGIGFQVVRPSKNARVTLLENDCIIGQAEYTPDEAVEADFKVTQGSNVPFVIIPSTFNPAKHAKFTVTVYSDSPFLLAPAPETATPWEGCQRVLDARNGVGSIGDDEWADDQVETAEAQATNATAMASANLSGLAPLSVGGTAIGTETVSADRNIHVKRPQNPLYMTSTGELGARPQQDHEKNKVFPKSLKFTNSFIGNYRGTAMN